MKIDRFTKHKPTWRVQKGCRVEWFVYGKKGVGIVKKVISADNGMWGKQAASVVIMDDVNGEVTVDVGNIRILRGKKDEN